jgi:hypothetical protein
MLEPFHTLVKYSRYQLTGPDPTNSSAEYMGESKQQMETSKQISNDWMTRPANVVYRKCWYLRQDRVPFKLMIA